MSRVCVFGYLLACFTFVNVIVGGKMPGVNCGNKEDSFCEVGGGRHYYVSSLC